MIRLLEIMAFLALSSVLHAATVFWTPPSSGASGGGDDGAARVTLQAARPTLAAMVEDWDRPPDVSAAPALKSPATVEASTSHAMPKALPAPDGQAMPVPKAPDMPALAPMPNALPKLDTSPAATSTAPPASPRPESRPDQFMDRAAPAPQKAQSAAQKPQKAKGRGEKKTAAPARAAPKATGPSEAQRARLQQQWGAQITAALRRAHRPPRGVRGTTQLVIAITPAGRVTAVSVAASSGNARLDQSAIAAVKRARFPRAPKGLSGSRYRFSQRLTVSR
jgi:protein TonB